MTNTTKTTEIIKNDTVRLTIEKAKEHAKRLKALSL